MTKKTIRNTVEIRYLMIHAIKILQIEFKIKNISKNKLNRQERANSYTMNHLNVHKYLFMKIVQI